MNRLMMTLAGTTLTGCSPSWPTTEFPAEAAVERILFAENETGLREGCVAMVAELSDKAAMRLVRIGKAVTGQIVIYPPAGWSNTPISQDTSASYYKSAFGGCGNGLRPLGDLRGALNRSGNFYKIINGGEGIAIIEPRAKLAGYFYFG